VDKAEEEKFLKASPLVRSIVPAVSRAWYHEAEGRTRLAMLRAAMHVNLEGREALKKHRDPYGDGPFEYRPLENGRFELKSRLSIPIPRKGPLTLTVGKTPKPAKER